jgi:hypothetical protein
MGSVPLLARGFDILAAAYLVKKVVYVENPPENLKQFYNNRA